MKRALERINRIGPATFRKSGAADVEGIVTVDGHGQDRTAPTSRTPHDRPLPEVTTFLGWAESSKGT